MDSKDALKMMEEKPELAKSLEEALRSNADEKELAGILVDAGFDAVDAEALIAEYQRKRGATIALQELDDDELDQVAGGGDGINCSSSSDCDDSFKDSRYWNYERCQYGNYCDEYVGSLLGSKR